MRAYSLLILPLLAVASTATAAPSSDVAAPVKRAVSVDFAAKLLSPQSKTADLTAPINPFTLNGSRMAEAEPDQGQAAAAKAAMMASNRSLLIALAELLEPKGTFIVGGEAIILLGQKKLKVGDVYPITFEGAVFELEITAIETTRFSVRYKNEEITRPIVITKSAK
jgi:hypothetical protein